MKPTPAQRNKPKAYPLYIVFFFINLAFVTLFTYLSYLIFSNTIFKTASKSESNGYYFGKGEKHKGTEGLHYKVNGVIA